jgi:hypothetical protein
MPDRMSAIVLAALSALSGVSSAFAPAPGLSHAPEPSPSPSSGVHIEVYPEGNAFGLGGSERREFLPDDPPGHPPQAHAPQGPVVHAPAGYGKPIPECREVEYREGRDRDMISSCNVFALVGTERTPWWDPTVTPEQIDEVVASAGAPIVVTAEEMQSLPIDSGGLTVQPAQPWVLVNMDTIVMTGATDQILETTVLGVPVRVWVTPVEYAWDFGDGTVEVGTDPGSQWPDYTVAHAYTSPGVVQISLTTQWEGVFQVAGSPDWLPVQGRAVTQETSEPIEAVTAVPRLVVPGG